MQAFVTDWPGEKQHAKANARILAPYCSSVTILDDPNDYFSAQWEKARSLLTDDIMIFNAGDCWPPIQEDLMFDEIKNLLSDGTGIGVYSPLIRWSNWQFPKITTEYNGVYTVPIVEMLFFAIRRDIVEAMPHGGRPDWIGVGIAYAMSATAKRLGLKMVSDTVFTAAHPDDVSGYPKADATKNMYTWLNSLDSEDRDAIQSVISECFSTVLTGEENMKSFKITKEEIEKWRR
jgi:hypothetical protein